LDIVSFEDAVKSITQLQEQYLSLQKENIELSNKLEVVTDELFQSNQKVRIGPGFWNMNSTIVVGLICAYLFCIIIIGLEYSGFNVKFNSPLVWPISVLIFGWSIVQNTSNKQYKLYQEQCDEMLITRLKNAIKEGVAESKAEWKEADAREERARLKLEADTKADREKSEATYKELMDLIHEVRLEIAARKTTSN
jgi:hypothetical protein